MLGAAVLYRLGMLLEKSTRSRAAKVGLFALAIVIALPGLLFALYYTHFFDNAAWFYGFRALPFTEFLVSGLGLLAGVLQARFEPETFGEKLVVPSALLVLVMIPFVKPLVDPLDLGRLRDRCEGEVCMQSTFSTCGPSSSATLLKLYLRASSERELATECLTSRGGTEIWYMARAFDRRGFHTRVVIQSPNRLSPPSPAIAGVVLPGGAGHFIAIMDATPDEITIGDPMKGKLVIKRSEIEAYYRFTGFFLAIEPKVGFSPVTRTR